MNRYRPGQIDGALGAFVQRALDRCAIPAALPHEVHGEIERLLDADAAVTEVPLCLIEHTTRRRVMEIDVVAIGEHELDAAEGVETARVLTHAIRETVRRHRGPINGARIHRSEEHTSEL